MTFGNLAVNQTWLGVYAPVLYHEYIRNFVKKE
jgi:hypothetical protein